MDLFEVFLRLLTATVLGILLGAERSLARKHAGMRTYALVSLGSAIFVILGIIVTKSYIGITNFDPMRTLAAVISGIGFIGAGLIIMKGDDLKGLTTAAGLWVSAAVGASVAFGFYQVAFFSTLLVIIIFTALWFAENKLKRWWDKQSVNKKRD